MDSGHILDVHQREKGGQLSDPSPLPPPPSQNSLMLSCQPVSVCAEKNNLKEISCTWSHLQSLPPPHACFTSRMHLMNHTGVTTSLDNKTRVCVQLWDTWDCGLLTCGSSCHLRLSNQAMLTAASQLSAYLSAQHMEAASSSSSHPDLLIVILNHFQEASFRHLHVCVFVV